MKSFEVYKTNNQTQLSLFPQRIWKLRKLHFSKNNDISALFKYTYFHKEQCDKKSKDNPFLIKNLYYDIKDDTFYSPMGQTMEYKFQYHRKSKTRF